MSASSRPVTGSGKRALVALAMGAIMTPTLLAGPAFAQPVDPSETACPADVIDDAGFPDVEDLPADLQEAINCIAAYGITTGELSGNYNASGTVSRAQMALFFSRIAQYAADNGADIELDATDAGFTDLEGVSDQTQDAINILANLGVVQGKGDGSIYDPTGRITRAQMASFIARFHEALGAPLAEDGDDVPDAFMDDEDSVHEDNINLVAFAGIAAGKTATTFAPGESTSRGQMARFLARHLEVAVSAGVFPAIGDQPEEPAVTIDTAAEEIVAGAELAGTFANLPAGATVTVSGAGLTDQAVTVGANGAFTLTLPGDVEAGTQTLTFTITLEDGTELTVAVDVEVVEAPVETNETLTFGPDDAVALELSAGTTDRRSFLATGLDDALTYRVTLVESSLVTVDENGVVTFTNDADTGETGFAEVGAEVADIVAISNAGTIDAGANSATAVPVNGAVTVTIEGVARGSVVPVIYVNGGAPGNTPAQGGTSPRLELTAEGAPTEPFGIAGVTTFTNPEAAVGATAANQAVQAVDRDANVFDAAGFRYQYDNQNDVFTIGGAQATLAQFEAALSVGDTVDVTDYQREDSLRSTFNLNNIDPAAPALAVADINDTNVVLTVTGVDAGNTVRVYGQVDPTPGNAVDDPALTTASTLLATATADADAVLAGFQVVVTGLTPSTGYDLAVTQVEGDEESPLSAPQSVTTTATQVSPVITSAVVTTDTPIEGLVETDDVLTFTFNRGVDVAAAGGTRLSFTDADGDTFIVSNVAAGGGDFLTAATISATDVVAGTTGTETVTVTVLEAAEDRNAAGDGQIEFPITLTAIAGVTDTASTGDATLTGSDVTLP